MKGDAAPVYGDFHFHTCYSDNRDRSGFAEMVAAGRSKGLAVFRSADHHYNLDHASWRKLVSEARGTRVVATAEQTDGAGALSPGCEISFRKGHLVVVSPQTIDGTFLEGFRYWYRDPGGAEGCLKIIAHPVRPWEIWRRTRFPNVDAVELVNGEVYRFFGPFTRLVHSLRLSPALGVYRRYLRSGMPVAAVGSSDAHDRKGTGLGVTGLWLRGRCDTAEAAVRERRCFAATDTGIRIRWRLEDNLFSWEVTIDGLPVRRVVLYRGGRIVGRRRGEGSLRLERPGFYWVAFRSGGRLGISSPVEYQCERAEPKPYRKAEAEPVADDLAHLSVYEAAVGPAPPEGFPAEPSASGSLETVIYARVPKAFDPAGTRVRLRKRRVYGLRVVIRTVYWPPRFREFLLWLSRNEVYEYALAELRWELRGRTLRVRGTAVPGLRTDPRTWPQRMKGLCEAFERDAAAAERVDVLIRTLPRWRVKLTPRTPRVVIRDGALVSDVYPVAVPVPEAFVPLFDGARRLPAQLVQVFRGGER